MSNVFQVFEKELKLISDPLIKDFTISALKVLPDYFFVIPASSTGKYHPSYALGEGGLVRHTRAAVHIAYCMFGNKTITSKFSDEMKDMIISALILHDGVKSGIKKETYTVENHAVLLVQHVHEKMCVIHPGKYDDIMPRILALVSTHMGQWNTSKDGEQHSPLPSNGAQAYVHMCDYLASRKILEFNFDAI